MVVLSHRHNKEDTIASKDERNDLDFTIVRDTMYKYSKKAQERFFKNQYLAFLFVAFSSSKDGSNFIRQKFADKGIEYLDRMGIEMDELKTEAAATIKKMKNERGCKDLFSLLNLFPSQKK